MGLQDLFVTPIYLLLFLAGAYVIRPYVTNEHTRKFFIPALLVRLGGAIALGLIYQFYYNGGDTFNYFSQASIIHEAFVENPIDGFKLLISNGRMHGDIFEYASQMYWFSAPAEYMVIRIAGFLSLITLNSYYGISIFFGVFSFIGVWLIYSIFEELFPHSKQSLALAVLFIPSSIFWGSGLLKDTLTLGGIGILLWCFYRVFICKRYAFHYAFLLVLSAGLIYAVKIYVLLCLIPSIFLWWYLENISKIKNVVLRFLLAPLLMFTFGFTGYFFLDSVAGTSSRYKLDSLPEWSYITSYDIRYFTGKNAGSGYDLGEQDGSWGTLIKLAPAAINVSLFRPYLWEVRNPLMLLSAFESLVFLWFTSLAFLRVFTHNRTKYLRRPIVIMSLVFAVTFAFAVGVSTYNFGSLSRYKIPLLPFYAAVLAISTHKTERIGEQGKT